MSGTRLQGRWMIRLDEAGHELVRRAAALEHLPIAAWIRSVLLGAAKKRVRAEERES